MTETIQRVYSQRGEQSAILAAVGEGIGTFLEIGAWNARDMSNTRALYELGWKGVMVEPSPDPFLGILREYGNDEDMVLIPAAVGLERGLARFHISSDALSTSSEESFEKWAQVGGFYGVAYVPVITLADIMNQFGAFDFVSIDTEGTSVDLFLDLLKTTMRPRCLCVEFDRRGAECQGAAERAGYRKVYESTENMVFAS